MEHPLGAPFGPRHTVKPNVPLAVEYVPPPDDILAENEVGILVNTGIDAEFTRRVNV